MAQLPMDPDAAREFHAPLLPEYCSKSLPKLRTESGGDAWIYTKLATEGIGRQSKVDLAFGVIGRNVTPALDRRGRKLPRAGMTFRTPTGLLVLEFVIHRPSFGTIMPEVIAFQNMPSDDIESVARGAPQLQLREKITQLGPADEAIDTPEWPRYRKLMRFAAQQLGWDLAEFEILRLRVEHPVFGSVIRMQLGY